jgi:hypothetical protein
MQRSTAMISTNPWTRLSLLLALALAPAACGGNVVVQDPGGGANQGLDTNTTSGGDTTGGNGTGGGGNASTGGSDTTGGGNSTGGGFATGGGSDGSCSVVGAWDGKSGVDGSNPPSQASFQFNADGTWIGGFYGADIGKTQFMHGTYAVANGVFTIVTGYGMGPLCSGTAEATYGLTFDPGCGQMKMLTQTDNCTGARLYMSAAEDGTVFVRR